MKFLRIDVNRTWLLPQQRIKMGQGSHRYADLNRALSVKEVSRKVAKDAKVAHMWTEIGSAFSNRLPEGGDLRAPYR